MTECIKCGEREYYAKGLCKRCYTTRYDAKHRDEKRAYNARYRASRGGKTMNANRDCALFLGVHVAERVLSKVFNNVQRMPMGNRGFDFICNRGMKIDVKSGVMNRSDRHICRWQFSIKRNTVPDYFLCIAFDNRDDLNPLHMWLIPGDTICHKSSVAISESTIDKWDEYMMHIDETIACCDDMKTRTRK